MDVMDNRRSQNMQCVTDTKKPGSSRLLVVVWRYPTLVLNGMTCAPSRNESK